MPESRLRVLIVNPKLNQAVGIKNALDAVGGFDVRPFTSSVNALDYARTAVPDAAVLDLTIRSPGIAETAVALRRLNPKIKLLLTNAPDEAVVKLRADGLIALPTRARDLEPMMRALFPPDPDARPHTPSRRPIELREQASSRPSDDHPPTRPSRESAITKPDRENAPTRPDRRDATTRPGAESAGPDPFQQLSDDEPPVPTAMEGGTVREAVRAMLPRQPLDESMYVVEITPRPSDTDEDEPIPGSGDWQPLTPSDAVEEEQERAELEEAAQEAKTPAETLTDAPDAEPEAAEAETGQAGPEAPPEMDLNERLAAEEPSVPKGETAAPTKRNNGIKAPNLPPVKPILPTGQMPPVLPLAKTSAPPAKPAAPPAFDDSDADLDEPAPDAGATTRPPVAVPPRSPVQSPPPIEQPPAPEPQAAAPPIVIPGQRRPVKKKDAEAPPEAEPAVSIPGQRRPVKKKAAAAEPKAASSPAELKRALVLTHEQIGTTAAALILTQGNEVLAHSGEMPTQEIEELQRVIGGDWEAQETHARLRYITLPTSRQEYMLHTRRTENGYALSMAFAGDLALSVIRAQSDAVAENLQAMRMSEEDERGSGAPAAVSRLPFTAVWMLDNPEIPLTADIAQAVVLQFDKELRALDWTIHAMNVHADFVYVFCEVQTTYLASEVVAELKRISAEAACARRPNWSPDELWADAYMALMPGRELGSDEVESFLAFTRSRLRPKAR